MAGISLRDRKQNEHFGDKTKVIGDKKHFYNRTVVIMYGKQTFDSKIIN